MKKKNEEITLKDIVSVFIPKLWIIVIVAIACAAVLGIYSAFLKKDTYTATADMLVMKSNSQGSYTDSQATEKMVPIYEYLLNSDRLLALILSSMPEEYEEYNITTDYLRNAISFNDKGYGMFGISVTTDNQKLSYDLASCIQIVAPIEFLNVDSNFYVQVTDEADFPAFSDDKNVVRNTIIGFFAGMIVSALAIWLISVLDTSIYDKKKIEDNFDIPVLGVIPMHDLSDKKEASGDAV